ncbi:hypothetical protein OG349_16770 [Streptomyces sp. NBC_01317]|uniref:hypothetical protein n=1 Tax=Streptomyces sp. NBC_01317 TaxID=2903822 RepID=UPI002E159AA3|nr:hypothetical protein OG349_16770 [Streptomyces sp. NBC_01317]
MTANGLFRLAAWSSPATLLVVTYVVSVETHIAQDSPETDPLQRAGAVAILESGLDSVEGIEGPDGMEADLHESLVAVRPGGALLRIFVDAPALEFAEEAVRSVVGELLERSELLAEWTVDKCEVQLHPGLAREGLAAADGPDVPPDDSPSRLGGWDRRGCGGCRPRHCAHGDRILVHAFNEGRYVHPYAADASSAR